MITINHGLKEAICLLFGPLDVIIGTITREIELTDVRIQIARDRLEGYYVKWNDQVINILPNGDLDRWPSGFYDHQLKQFAELVKLKRR